MLLVNSDIAHTTVTPPFITYIIEMFIFGSVADVIWHEALCSCAVLLIMNWLVPPLTKLKRDDKWKKPVEFQEAIFAILRVKELPNWAAYNCIKKVQWLRIALLVYLPLISLVWSLFDTSIRPSVRSFVRSFVHSIVENLS